MENAIKRKENNGLLCLLYSLTSLVTVVPAVMLLIKEPNSVQFFIKYLPHLIYPAYTLIFSLLFVSLAEKLTVVKKVVLSLNYVLPLFVVKFASKAELYKGLDIGSYHSFVAYISFALEIALVVFTLLSTFLKNPEKIPSLPYETSLKKAIRIISVSVFCISWLSSVVFASIEKFAPKSGFLYESIEIYTGEGMLGFVFLVIPASSVVTGMLMFLFREKLTSLGNGIIFIGGIMMILTFFAAKFSNIAMLVILVADAVLVAASLLIILSKSRKAEDVIISS